MRLNLLCRPSGLISSTVAPALMVALACPIASNAFGASSSPSRRSAAAAYTFAFQDAPIRQAAEQILGTTLGLTYTIDPDVTGNVSFRIDQSLTRAQLFEAFEAALEANDVTIVRNGDSVEVEPLSKAKGSAGIQPSGNEPAVAGYTVEAIPLGYAIPSEVGKALEAMGRKGLVLYTDDKQGLIVIGGTARELDAAKETLLVLDQSGLKDTRTRWFSLQQAPAKTVAAELKDILKAAGSTGIAVVGLPRLNGVLVFAHTPEALDEVSRLIERLDAPAKDNDQGIWVYHPVNLSAQSLASTLRSALGGQASESAAESKSGLPGGSQGGFGSMSSGPMSSAPMASGPMSSAPMFSGGMESALAPPGPGLSGPGDSLSGPGGPSRQTDSMHIGVNKDSNVLIIKASAAQWVQIQRILQEVDRAPDQVLIEASVLEVTLTNTLNMGVDWSVIGAGQKFTSTLSNNVNGTLSPSYPGLSVSYLGKSISATISALKAITDVTVVSDPRVLVLDNHPAKLEVGDQVPITLQSAQSTEAAGAPIVVSTQYMDTGVILDVTPRISGQDHVVLDVDQQVSAVAQTTSSNIDSPTIQQRRIQSTLMLKDGATVALGGLISDNKTKTQSGIPFLTRVPVLGDAFKSNTNEHDRTELVVLMTAKIIRDSAGANRLADALSADMKEIRARGLLKP